MKEDEELRALAIESQWHGGSEQVLGEAVLELLRERGAWQRKVAQIASLNAEIFSTNDRAEISDLAMAIDSVCDYPIEFDVEDGKEE